MSPVERQYDEYLKYHKDEVEHKKLIGEEVTEPMTFEEFYQHKIDLAPEIRDPVTGKTKEENLNFW